MSGVGSVWGLFGVGVWKEARLFTCKCVIKRSVEVRTDSSPGLHRYTYYVVFNIAIDDSSY